MSTLRLLISESYDPWFNLAVEECIFRQMPASKHKAGDYICKVAVENSAQYQFKWTDGITEPKFSSYSWYDKDKKLVTLYGHRAQAQNGFGAFKNIEYPLLTLAKY
ncbi:MAG: hypothetical protein H6R25_2435 [Proteobacteria bacterium]|nr:hypothetical protein [Pseudomonadota bacterium]